MSDALLDHDYVSPCVYDGTFILYTAICFYALAAVIPAAGTAKQRQFARRFSLQEAFGRHECTEMYIYNKIINSYIFGGILQTKEVNNILSTLTLRFHNTKLTIKKQ